MLKLKRKKVKKVKKSVVKKDFMNPPVVEAEEVIVEPVDTTTPIEKVFKKAAEIDSRCSDYTVKVANPNTVRLQDDLSLSYTTSEKETRNASFNHFALSQFGTKIGVPANYLEKCLNKDRADIAQYNVNAWLQDFNKPLFIREYEDLDGNNKIRGVLSDKYSVCDTPEIIDGLKDAIDLGTFNLKGSYVSEERFHLRLVDSEMLPVDGEDLFAGIILDSSDVGRSTLRVNFLIFKQVCTNGLVVNRVSTQLFKQKHIGISAEAFSNGLHEGLDLFPKITAKVVDSIEKTRNVDAPFNFHYEDDEQLADLVTSIRKQTGLSPVHANNVIDIMTSKRYEDNRWGYVNALTDVAKGLTLEKRLVLEENAGRLLVA